MISFVYFDVGGVVIDDFSGNNKWQLLQDELGIDPKDSSRFEQLWDEFEPDLVVGRDVESLLPIINEKFGLNIPTTYSLLNGLVSRFYANTLIWPIVERVNKKEQLGLLTNMYPGMFSAIKQKNILPPINWQVIIDSSIEMLSKPDYKLFELAEKKAKSKGQNILFIDNSSGHVKEAKAFGWNVYHYDSSNHSKSTMDLESFLETNGLI